MFFPLFPVAKTTLFQSRATAKKVASALVLTLVLSVAFTTLLATYTEPTLANHSQCSDGQDNDNDNKRDYPQDDDCASLDDDFEGIGLNGNFITVTDGKEKAQPGEGLVYVITLKQQRQDARVVNLSLHLPHQANIVSASDGGDVRPGMVTWTNVSVYKNVTRTLTVNVNVRPDASIGQYIIGRAIVEGVEATDTTLVENYAPVANDTWDLSLTDNKDYIMPGEVLTYVARVRNTASDTRTTDVRAAMPYVTNFLSASEGGKRDNFNVTWKNVSFAPNETKTFTFSVLVDRDAVDRSGIRARVYAGTLSAGDTTTIRIGLPYDAVSATISDGRNTVSAGQNLTYNIRVTNASDVVGTNVAVDAGIPTYGQFVSASNGGITDGTNVRWIIVQMAPRETRTLSYTVRVRSDAPLNTVMTASAVADGVQGKISYDYTTVVANSTESSNYPGNTSQSENVLFRKTADRAEAVPGGSIRYTLFVRNTLDHAITDAVITDRYDSNYLRFVRADDESGLVKTPGVLRWTVPTLQPGQTWSTSYVLSISDTAPNGLELDNIATISGSDLDSISLTERVRTSKAGVINEFPQTGAGMDAAFALIMGALALAPAGLQRKLAGDLI